MFTRLTNTPPLTRFTSIPFGHLCVYPCVMAQLFAPVVVALAAALVAGCASSPTSQPAPSDAIVSADAGGLAEQATTVSALRTAEGEQLITLELPGGSYTPVPPEGSTDDYRCFILDLPEGTAGFATGFEVAPGNPEVTHHAILYRAYPDQLEAAAKLDAADDRPGYECFGGSGLPPRPGNSLNESDWLTAWAPGGRPSATPEGYGVPIPAGGKVVLQMHYNTRAGIQPDTTVVRMRMAAPEAALNPLFTTLLPAPVELPCAEGQSGPLCDRAAAVADLTSRFGNESGLAVQGLQWLCGQDNPITPGVTQSCTRTIRQDTTVFSVAGHMHLLGRSIAVDVNPGTPQEQRILDVTNYDFDNQSARPLAQPLQLRAGDKVRVTCTHDPTLRGKLPGVPEEPRYVVWGEGTTDEMCLGVLIGGREAATG